MRKLLAAAAILAVAASAHAQTEPQIMTDQAIGRAPPPRAAVAPGLVGSTDINGLLAALQRAGFTGEVKTEGRESYVLGRHGTTPFQAFLAGCQPSGGGCPFIELYAGFSGTQRIPLERINGWNARTPFTRAFLDEDRDPSLVMNINLQGGVSPESLKAQLEMWGEALDTYSLFLVARIPPVGAVTPPAEQPKR